MKKFTKENWFKIMMVMLFLYLGLNLLFKDKYTGFYYPSGCLVCDDYIVSPQLNSLEDCVKWVEGLKSNSKNTNDKWECGKNCKFKNGLNVCEETFGTKGTGIDY